MKIFNKRARFDYQVLESIEAGISLSGGEAKAVRTGHVNLTGSFVKIINGEAYLVNANIPIAGKLNYNPSRSRKLLLHKSQIIDLLVKTKREKLTLVPIVIYTKKRLVKLEVALGKGKRKFEKKEALKKIDIQRDIDNDLKGS
jgi:SsrA-binding protein